MSSIYERMGGQDGMQHATELFYRKVLLDDRVSGFFDDVDMQEQINKQKGFLTMILGGPHRYTGKGMRASHSHLVARGLNDGHVDAIVEHLSATLRELGATTADVQAAADLANSVRDEVLGR